MYLDSALYIYIQLSFPSGRCSSLVLRNRFPDHELNRICCGAQHHVSEIQKTSLTTAFQYFNPWMTASECSVQRQLKKLFCKRWHSLGQTTCTRQGCRPNRLTLNFPGSHIQESSLVNNPLTHVRRTGPGYAKASNASLRRWRQVRPICLRN